MRVLQVIRPSVETSFAFLCNRSLFSTLPPIATGPCRQTYPRPYRIAGTAYTNSAGYEYDMQTALT